MTAREYIQRKRDLERQLEACPPRDVARHVRLMRDLRELQNTPTTGERDGRTNR